MVTRAPPAKHPRSCASLHPRHNLLSSAPELLGGQGEPGVCCAYLLRAVQTLEAGEAGSVSKCFKASSFQLCAAGFQPPMAPTLETPRLEQKLRTPSHLTPEPLAHLNPVYLGARAWTVVVVCLSVSVRPSPWLSARLSGFCLSVCLAVSLSVSLSGGLSVCLSLCLSFFREGYGQESELPRPRAVRRPRRARWANSGKTLSPQGEFAYCWGDRSHYNKGTSASPES